MVNVYINELENKNYLEREYISAKIVNYRITPEGIKRKNYLSISYIRELLDLYQLGKKNVERFLQDIENKGFKTILLYGAGEVAETIIGVIRDRESTLKVQGIIDDDKNKKDKTMLGYKIITREDIKNYEHDAIIITSYTFEEDIMDKLKEIDYPRDKVMRFFSE